MNTMNPHTSPSNQVPKVRVLGGPHSFHSLAAGRFYPEGAQLIACESVAEALDLQAGDRAVVAVENKLVGRLEDHLALIADSGLHVHEEIWVEVDLAVAASQGSTLAELRELRSHPVALAQCRTWLGHHANIRLVEWKDTASALASVQDAGVGAIGSATAAQEMGLQVLARDVADGAGNATRFVLVGRQAKNKIQKNTEIDIDMMQLQSNNHSLRIPHTRWSSMIDLRPRTETDAVPPDPDGPGLAGAHALAGALEARLEVDPVNGGAELRWPRGGIHSDRLRDELYLRTGVLLDAPRPGHANKDMRVQLPMGLPVDAYGEAADRIRKHAFYFWQRTDVTGTL